MKFLAAITVFTFFLNFNAFASTPEKLASFNKVKNVYVGHLQQKIIVMSEMTKCMSEGMDFKDLKKCSKSGKAKIALLDKKAHDAHLKAKKKKNK
ncbi:MAG: hypothetical protein HOO06_09070 [Bdellovibrionaceae bacterium]|jgi:hypothetical protein|nr:hypothetical protein [Pseudobdellovibrionaceae bacterium]